MEQSSQLTISSQLQSGEQLIWSGKPPTGVRFRFSDIFLIPFSLFWGGFAFFWEYIVIKSGFIPFIIVGLPFVVTGLYLIVGRFFVDSWRRKQTYYGLTNERVIIVSGIAGKKIRSLSLRTLTDISLSEKSNGAGTITFGSDTPLFSWFGNASWPGFGDKSAPQFELDRDVKNVYDMILKAQKNACQR